MIDNNRYRNALRWAFSSIGHVSGTDLLDHECDVIAAAVLAEAGHAELVRLASAVLSRYAQMMLEVGGDPSTDLDCIALSAAIAKAE